MKKILSLLIVIAVANAAMAQKPSVSVSVNAGIASPMGNLSKNTYDDLLSGYAKTGFHGNVTGVVHLNKNWGIGLLVGYTQFTHSGSQSLGDGYKEDSGTDSTTLFTKGTTHTFSVLAGPYYTIPVTKKTSVNLRAMGGYVKASLAGFQVFFEDYTDNALTQKESGAGTFGFQAGAGVQVNVTSKIAVLANADYFYAKPNITIGYDNFVVNSGRRLTTYNEAFSGVNATLGMGFKLF